MTAQKLEACPFCLLPGDMLSAREVSQPYRGATIDCPRCGARGPIMNGPRSQAIPRAIKRWNWWRRLAAYKEAAR